VHHTVSSLGNLRRDLQVSVIMPYQRSGYALRVSRALPEGIADGLGEIERGRHEYEKLLILRRGLLLSFMATLTLSFVMVLATALWVSLRLGLQLVKPLVKITAAAQAVGRGDFNQRLPAGNQEDEIAKLSHAFNSMVDDLDRSQQQVSERQAALSEANTSLENLLSSLTAGVLVLDGQGRLIRANRSAEQLLKISLVSFVGLHVDNWAGMDSLAAMIKKITASGVASAEHRLSQDEEGRTLLVRLRQLTTIAGGLLVVVDDISGQLQAERDAIWEEASQRFAHEIKNPLTPIQLAAERLENKLGGKLETDDAELLSRMSTTITNQVTAMREMVDSFRSYANNQRRRMKATDLNQLAAEVAQLYEYPGLTLQLKWDEKLPAVAGDALLLRQVLHNLLGNASDAVLDKPSPHIVVQTSVADEYAQLSIEDNGGGVAENLIDQVFSPYVTTKTQGTGLGLAVVRKVMEEHGGEARLENVNNGARMLLRIPLWQQGNGN
jgi:nitrogen fixation/metabolism regulation signal transduction histidine kinase